MSGKSGKRYTGKREGGQFVAFPATVLHSTAFKELSAHALKLLMDIASQYRGNNNGDLTAAWKIMKARGWKSEETLNRAKKDLLASGLVCETRKGRRPNVCSLYALTSFALDPDPKHDISPRGFQFGAWKQREAVALPVSGKIKALATPSVAGKPA